MKTHGYDAAPLFVVQEKKRDRLASHCLTLWRKDGRTYLPGSSWSRELAHLTDLTGLPSPVNGGMGGNTCASRTRNLFFRDHVLLPSLPPSHRALLNSQAGPHAAAWLQAIPSDPHTSLTPEAMQIALRRRLRLQLPLAPGPAAGALRNLVAAAIRMLLEIMHLPALAPPPGKAGQT